ncbi:MAG TPA: peptidylprolyl isomerase, partial [Actinomycetota bacterium]|nr:peptidylprolyl isomerase [Actinomycetota bacterium]
VTPTAATDNGAVACGAQAPPQADKPKPQFAGPPPRKIDTKATYRATMVTSCGTLVIELDAKRAPQTVNSFVFLAEKGYFDGQYFHRLDTSIDVIQGGDPTGTGQGGPGYAIPDELKGDEKYTPGTLAMANAGPNTGGSQFFIITGPAGANLNSAPNYTIFGHIVKGLDVAKRIQQLPIVDPEAAANGDLSGQRPKEAVYLERVTISKR